MRILISFMTAVSLGLTGTVLSGDNYIKTPESSGHIPAADTAIVPALFSDNSTTRSRPNENP
jgi:hypothetical protein